MVTNVLSALVFVAAIALPIVGMRVARSNGWIKTLRGRCESCSELSSLIHATYHQNTGMIVARQHKSLEGNLCRNCSLTSFAKLTGHCLVLGWWGMISFMLNCLFIVNNVAMAMATLALPKNATLAKSALDEHREYALALVATKDEDTVVEVLMKQCAASEQDVRDYVRGLYKQLAA